jgi:hypothetical protein
MAFPLTDGEIITWLGLASLPPSINTDNEPSKSLLWAENDIDGLTAKRSNTPERNGNGFK